MKPVTEQELKALQQSVAEMKAGRVRDFDEAFDKIETKLLYKKDSKDGD